MRCRRLVPEQVHMDLNPRSTAKSQRVYFPILRTQTQQGPDCDKLLLSSRDMSCLYPEMVGTRYGRLAHIKGVWSVRRSKEQSPSSDATSVSHSPIRPRRELCQNTRLSLAIRRYRMFKNYLYLLEARRNHYLPVVVHKRLTMSDHDMHCSYVTDCVGRR